MTFKKKLSILNNYVKSNITKSKILLYKNKVNFIKTDKIKNHGYLYIAFKKNFLDEAILSALSLKQNTKKKIAIFTDIKDERLNKVFDFIGIINPSNIRSKVDFISKSPFKKTVYLDSDTFIKNNIDDIFEILNYFDVVGCIDSARKRKYISDKISEYAKIPYGFSEINGGVLAFKSNKKVNFFLEIWKKKFFKYLKETSGWDQPSLRIALWNSKVKLHILPPEYNVRSKEVINKIKKIKKKLGPEHMQDRILHMHYSRNIHNGNFKVKNLKELEKKISKKKISINF
tara:strand:+ start:2069 stop:2929 length:861 start_codon:yes stop_codon:yes gene_type:complete